MKGLVYSVKAKAKAKISEMASAKIFACAAKAKMYNVASRGMYDKPL